jgi:hypothetical protein
MLRVKHHQMKNQNGIEEGEFYLLIQVIKKIIFVINNYHKKYYKK